MLRFLSLLFDLMLFTSLGMLVLGGIQNQFALLPITFVLTGVIVQAILLRRFSLIKQRRLNFTFIGRKKAVAAVTKLCQYCNRAISADARICRFCLTEVDEHPTPSMNVASPATQIVKSQLETERWRESTNAFLL